MHRGRHQNIETDAMEERSKNDASRETHEFA